MTSLEHSPGGVAGGSGALEAAHRVRALRARADALESGLPRSVLGETLDELEHSVVRIENVAAVRVFAEAPQRTPIPQGATPMGPRMAYAAGA